MKKILILTLGLFITVVGVSSCENEGESDAEVQARLDSLRQDSILQAERLAAIEDSINQARMDSMQALNDSLMNADPEVVYVNTGSNKKDDETPAPTEAPQEDPAPPKPNTTDGKVSRGDGSNSSGKNEGKVTRGDGSGKMGNTNEGKTESGKVRRGGGN